MDCNGMDEPCVTWTGGVTRTGPRQYMYQRSVCSSMNVIKDVRRWNYILWKMNFEASDRGFNVTLGRGGYCMLRLFTVGYI